MLHLFALIHANFAQLMYHCSSEGSHWRFNYLLDFGVCMCLCCIVGKWCVFEYSKGLFVDIAVLHAIVFLSVGFYYNCKCLYVCPSVCECLSAKELNPMSAGTFWQRRDCLWLQTLKALSLSATHTHKYTHSWTSFCCLPRFPSFPSLAS